jgi:hypothetical protein
LIEKRLKIATLSINFFYEQKYTQNLRLYLLIPKAAKYHIQQAFYRLSMFFEFYRLQKDKKNFLVFIGDKITDLWDE